MKDYPYTEALHNYDVVWQRLTLMPTTGGMTEAKHQYLEILCNRVISELDAWLMHHFEETECMQWIQQYYYWTLRLQSIRTWNRKA